MHNYKITKRSISLVKETGGIIKKKSVAMNRKMKGRITGRDEAEVEVVKSKE